MAGTLNLVFPEWASSGNPRLHAATRRLADAVFGAEPATLVDVPAEETLIARDTVLGLDAVAAGCARAMARIRAADPDRLMTVAGTCGAEAAPVWFLNEKYDGDLAVVWFDAHADLNTPASSPSGKFHGMILRTLLGDGPDVLLRQTTRPLSPRQVVLAGTRDWDPDETAYVRTHRVTVVGDVTRASMEQVVGAIRAVGLTRVYVHLDVDVLNPSSFPDTLMSVPGGPSLEELADALAPIGAALDVVGASVVEYLGDAAASCQALAALVSRLRPRG